MAVEFKDYYATLGVAKDASAEEIKRAFRRLAMQFHPDKARGDKQAAEAKFKEINEAYEVLGDPEKRAKYDRLGAGWQQHHGAPPGWQEFRAAPGGETEFEFHFGGTGFSDFFEQFFGGNRGGFTGFDHLGFESAPGPPVAERGADIEGDILVTLEEALRGATRAIRVQRTNPRTGQSETQTYRVRIPAGVQEGQLIRLAGRGHDGHAGGAPGDLYLRVKFAKHPEFRARGADLYYDLALAPWEAVLGARVRVPTLTGNATLSIPSGTANGQSFRLRGQGLPATDGRRGDLYAVVTVAVPTAVTSGERAAWERLRDVSAFEPRSNS